MRYPEGNGKKNLRGFFGKDNRSAIIMLNAAIVLVVVIIALAVQLVRLNGQGKRNEESIESKAAVTEVPEATAASTPTSQIERIRKDLDKNKPMVALTFDDGPYDKVTDRLVKVLSKNDARATFFVVGSRVEKYADDLKYAYKHGNQIGTHTFSHSDLSKMKKSAIRKELDRSIKVVKKITGQAPVMLRPPYGNVNDKMRRTVKMPMIYWSVDTEDWKSRNKKKILKQCKKISDGDIVLMHDLYSTTADAVESLVPALKKKGFQLVTVEELFYYKGIDAQKGKVYFSGK